MQKANKKHRDIFFKSDKNDGVISVCSAAAKEYAKTLEIDMDVAFYETNVNLNKEKYQYMNPLYIRKLYFETEWTTDFVITYKDGKKKVRELVSKEMLSNRADMDRLEFSRRYWSLVKNVEWKILLIERSNQNVL